MRKKRTTLKLTWTLEWGAAGQSLVHLQDQRKPANLPSQNRRRGNSRSRYLTGEGIETPRPVSLRSRRENETNAECLHEFLFRQVPTADVLSPSQGYRVIISNLCAIVTQEDIVVSCLWNFNTLMQRVVLLRLLTAPMRSVGHLENRECSWECRLNFAGIVRCHRGHEESSSCQSRHSWGYLQGAGWCSNGCQKVSPKGTWRYVPDPGSLADLSQQSVVEYR